MNYGWFYRDSFLSKGVMVADALPGSKLDEALSDVGLATAACIVCHGIPGQYINRIPCIFCFFIAMFRIAWLNLQEKLLARSLFVNHFDFPGSASRDVTMAMIIVRAISVALNTSWPLPPGIQPYWNFPWRPLAKGCVSIWRFDNLTNISAQLSCVLASAMRLRWERHWIHCKSLSLFTFLLFFFRLLSCLLSAVNCARNSAGRNYQTRKLATSPGRR